MDTTELMPSPELEPRKCGSTDSILSTSTEEETNVEEGITDCLKATSSSFQPVFPEQENSGFTSDKLVHI